jgi:hypothetical protein
MILELSNLHGTTIELDHDDLLCIFELGETFGWNSIPSGSGLSARDWNWVRRNVGCGCEARLYAPTISAEQAADLATSLTAAVKANPLRPCLMDIGFDPGCSHGYMSSLTEAEDPVEHHPYSIRDFIDLCSKGLVVVKIDEDTAKCR